LFKKLALQVASQNGYLDIVRILIEKGLFKNLMFFFYLRHTYFIGLKIGGARVNPEDPTQEEVDDIEQSRDQWQKPKVNLPFIHNKNKNNINKTMVIVK
jgi:hypothetical protein